MLQVKLKKCMAIEAPDIMHQDVIINKKKRPISGYEIGLFYVVKFSELTL
jgi:hypothetical protein